MILPTVEELQGALETLRTNATNAFRGFGAQPDSIPRLLDGEEIESDYLTTRDFQELDALNRLQDAQQFLDAKDRRIVELERQVSSLKAERNQAQRLLAGWQDGNHSRPLTAADPCHILDEQS